MFHIDPYGCLKPCLMVDDVLCDLRDHSFQYGWENVIPRIYEKKVPKEFKCRVCPDRVFCNYCPSFFKLETGSETSVSKYTCDIGHFMSATLKEYQSTGEYSHIREKAKTVATFPKTEYEDK